MDDKWHDAMDNLPNQPEEGDVTQEATPDIQTIIQTEIAKAMGNLTGPPQSFEDVLAGLDPRDSDASLAMYEWLVKNGRIYKVGTLDGHGYQYIYQEPKGSTKAGYSPGSTVGGRMVDDALAKAEASGAKPVQKGICPHCYSAVRREEHNGQVWNVIDDDDDPNEVCEQSPDGKHGLA